MPRPPACRRSSCSRPDAAASCLRTESEILRGAPRRGIRSPRVGRLIRFCARWRADRMPEPRLLLPGDELQRRDLDHDAVARGHVGERQLQARQTAAVLALVLVADAVEPLGRRLRRERPPCRAARSAARGHRPPRGAAATRGSARRLRTLAVFGSLKISARPSRPEEPDRHGVRVAVAAGRADPRDLLGLEPRERAGVHVVRRVERERGASDRHPSDLRLAAEEARAASRAPRRTRRRSSGRGSGRSRGRRAGTTRGRSPSG